MGAGPIVQNNLIIPVNIICVRLLQWLVLKPLQFLNHCRSRINRIKQQILAVPKSPTLDSYNGRQLTQLSACLL